MAGFKDSYFGSAISDRIGSLSTIGLNLNDMLIKNSYTVGGPSRTSSTIMGGEVRGGYNNANYGNDWDLFNFATSHSASKSQAKDRRNYAAIREDLRNFARQDLIEEIIETLADESIIHDEKSFFCQPSEININVKDEIIDSLKSNFKKIYSLMGMSDGKRGWDLFKKWLTDGYLSFEIVYNDAETEIIGFKEIDPVYLRFLGINKKKKVLEWEYTNPDTKQVMVLPDSKIIYISYAGVDNNDRVSYVQRLMRAYNVLDIMEQSRVIYAVTQSVFNKLFTIPVGGKSKTQAKQSLATLISSYKEQVSWDAGSGELQINGSRNLPFYKEYWFPEKEGARPQVDSIGSDGPDLSNMEPLEYFANRLYRASKIPASRFEERGGGRFNLGSPADIERDEMRFTNFVGRLQTTFKEILLKPLWIQMILDHPNLENDSRFESELGLEYNKNNLFEMLKRQEILESQAKLIDTLKRIEGDGGDRESYFTTEVLVKEYLSIPSDVLEKNDELKKKMAEEKAKNDDGDSGGRRF